MLSDAIAEMSELIEVKDLRDPCKIRYPLVPTLFAIMLAWMCGYNSAVKVEMFWYIKFGILKKLIPNFPDHKISHDTVNRILSLIIVDDLNIPRAISLPPGHRHKSAGGKLFFPERIPVAVLSSVISFHRSNHGINKCDLFGTYPVLCIKFFISPWLAEILHRDKLKNQLR